MSQKRVVDHAASVRQRLLNLAKDRQEDFNYVLQRYAVERLLYRISESDHASRFILKGAALFWMWRREHYRLTKDADFLFSGPSDLTRIKDCFKEICGVESTGDGLSFDAHSVTAEEIREDSLYDGVRVKLTAHLAGAVIRTQVDLGFGDVVTPGATEAEYPTLLDHPPPRLRIYPRETVIAEKYEAMVKLGIANTRMKDFYDLSVLAREFEFEGATVMDAIGETFRRRGTQLPDTAPVALTPEFYESDTKQRQWAAFLARSAVKYSDELADAIALIRDFVLPVVAAASAGEPFTSAWHDGGPWAD
ncbi:MAG: nucleotidyl transferase AbiEii/AbiGii toxin family protein [Verrucomicrobia bacterium]|nr:nucleotidyl transferase AbiEii/AbiGii toxin family protein [Verrucomicrobiota bacterium]MDA1085848.1 nucleotidyl transferase AbiEii/AbiGii toxin family protein [Verrucomicrobiota bacterium]